MKPDAILTPSHTWTHASQAPEVPCPRALEQGVDLHVNLHSAGSSRLSGTSLRGQGMSLLLGLGLCQLALTQVGCQGLDWGNTDDTPTPTASPTPDGEATATPEVPASDVTTLTLGSDPVYFTLPDRSTVSISAPETSTGWDMVFSGNQLHLNGGESGSGAAWGLGPVGTGEADYDALTNHADVVGPIVYYDEFESVLTDWYDYIVSGSVHGLYSRYHVYAVRVDETHTYKVQIEDYYDLVNGSLESGMITFRWADVDSDSPTETLLDARAGGANASEDDPRNKYTYFSFTTGVMELSDEDAATSMAWDLAFKRYDVKLNGGVSGPKGVVGYDFQAGREETNSQVTSYTPESQLPDFEAASSAGITGELTEDRIGSIVSGSYQSGANGLEPSGSVYVITDASATRYFKFLVTDLAVDGDGTIQSVTFRSAEIK